MKRTFGQKVAKFLGFRGVDDCIQCGAEGNHGMVAVMSGDHGPALNFNDESGFGAYPICDACYHAPRVKAHFYVRSMMTRAVDRAGDPNLGR